jgi:hypothetical protein
VADETQEPKIVHADWCIGGGAGPCNCGADLKAAGFVLTQEEQSLIYFLGQVHKAYEMLPVLHSMDEHEFLEAINAAENIIMSRPMLRLLKFNDIQRAHVPPVAEASGGK